MLHTVIKCDDLTGFFRKITHLPFPIPYAHTRAVQKKKRMPLTCRLGFYDHANHVHYIRAGGAGDEKVSYRFEKTIGIISRKVIEGI